MIAEAPGTILQMLYLRQRIRKNGWKSFYEIGCGKGIFSKQFLSLGLSGKAIDLNNRACDRAMIENTSFVEKGQYTVEYGDFSNQEITEKYDVVFSCMVIEHIPNESRTDFMLKCKDLLSKNGRITCLVPSSMKHWGVEDDIAGHILRFERSDVYALAEELNMKVAHIAGLTYPVSNWLFRLSNAIVSKNEKDMLDKSQQERTVYTGSREVQFKTDFPLWTGFLLNPIVLFPLHLFQKLFRKNENSMVLYFELEK